ncbi:MAG: tetratricopeptide repeat protein [Acidobacteriia bacterium]|nr:tetratricopeptide repeat protein [Terriglobia bacterium]
MRGSRIGSRSLVLLAAVAALFPIPSALSQSPSDYQRATAEFRAKNYSSASTLFAAVETRTPGTTDALLLEGKCLVNLQKFTDAENALRRYLLSHPDSDDALYLLGFVLHRENHPKESLEIYTKAAAIKTPTADDLKVVALNYVLLGDYPDAIKWLETAVRIDPQNKDAWYYLGRAYYTRSVLPEARRAFMKVLEFDPHNSKAENNLGLILESEAKPEEAMDAYRKSIAWQEQDSRPSEQPYLNLGNLLIQENRIEEAIPLLEKAVQLAPGDGPCHVRLGAAYLRTNRLKEAQRELEEATRLAPENAAAHFQLGRLYKQIHSLDRAKEEFHRVEEIQSRAANTKPQTQ